MKKLFLISLLVCVGILQSLAFDYNDERGVTWSCDPIDNTSVRITSASGYEYQVVIPEKVYYGTNEYTVTEITFTFQDNKILEKVTWPSTVTEIPDNMFKGCSYLKAVENIKKVTYIRNDAFNGCTDLMTLDLGSCKIGWHAFDGCLHLQSIGESAKCTSIDYNAFSNCSSLEKIDLSMCTSVGDGAFSYCSSLQSVGNRRFVSIPNSAFFGCSSLENIDLSMCTSVGSYAFYGCSSLGNIDLPMCTSVGSSAFSDCSKLQSVGNPKLTSIPDYAFRGCSSLAKIDLSMCTSVGSYAFYGCSKLQSVGNPKLTSIPDYAFSGCSSLNKIDLSMCTSVGSYAFSGCSAITEVDLSTCKNIGSIAFEDCYSLQSVDLPKVESLGDCAFLRSGITKISLPETLKSMGYQCFDNVKEYTFNGMQPAVLSVYDGFPAFDESTYLIRVPESAIDTYKAADIWKNYADIIFSISDQLDYDVTTTAMDNQSGLEQAIGATNMKKVFSLKATGTINGYDIFMIRTKMTHLQHLDLTDADIVANSFAYYEGCSTSNNVVGSYSFYKLDNLVTLKLPKNVITIGGNAVASCGNLKSVDFPKSLKNIERYSFSGCSKLDNVVLPDGLESIGYSSFSSCNNLKTIQYPPSLKYIGGYAFSSCSSLEKISLPGLDRIDNNAFSSCSSLKEIRIPSTLQNIGNEAFYDCNNLADIYTYTVEPISIGQNTFGETTYKSARLWMPTQSYANYYYQTQWGQFDNDNYRWFDEPYKYMYINKDYTLSDANSASGDKGRFDGNPDIDVNPGGGLIVDGDKDQTADDIHLKADASNWATIIAKANVDAKRIFIDITIAANRWHFFCFPFDIKRSNIKCDGNFVFRYYDGKVRAEKGKGGWTDLPATEEYLKAGKGYIFQASANCTLSIMIEKEKFGKLPNVRFDCNLEANASTNEQDASWNFVGNPFTSFFDLNDMSYNAPVTRWNGSGYEAVAFFVQRPTGSSSIEFDPEHRMTQIGSNNRKTENAKKAMKRQLNPKRLLVNIAVSDGKNTDKTRVVFNQTKSNKYEMDCDAAKFESSASAVQLYSIEAQGGKMAINERPQGSVQLGFTAKAAGDYTISAERMDQPVLLKDNLMNITYDLSNGDYSFSSEAGTFDNRFMLLIDGGATGIADIAKEAGVNIMPSANGINLTGIDGKTVNVYSLSGALFATRTENGFLNLSKGVYIVEVGKMKAKVMVK